MEKVTFDADTVHIVQGRSLGRQRYSHRSDGAVEGSKKRPSQYVAYPYLLISFSVP